ncbi:molybdate ABC transporter substrate-binding protein [Algivirga pacifica]|uniref:Molybdate ABC transporter substrate-binding protein n=1 Tax=Algivirga pacifica TaxID=1162670 RepID=A0ABP9DAI5_9BACT
MRNSIAIKRSCLWGLLGCFYLLGCSKENKQELLVAVAASNFPVMQEIARQYPHKITLVQGASGQLYTQIQQGAPYDVYLPAAESYAERLAQERKSRSTPVRLSTNRLTGWSTSPALWSALIEGDTTKLQGVSIAMANPRTAPFGELAVAYLKAKGCYHFLEKQLVYGQSIAQVNHYIKSRQVTVAFSSQSSVPQLGSEALYTHSCENHFSISQAVLPLNDKIQTKDFVTFLQSSVAQNIFREYGFEVVN